MENEKCVLVTGGTGYVGSWVVKYLLEGGYTIRLTLRDKSKKEKFEHLEKIAESSSGKLELWEADLLKDGSYDEAVAGCEIVFHIASPFIFGKIKDPQKALVDPALEGTKNVLAAASKSKTVKKVILTSSVVSIYGDAIDLKKMPGGIANESRWNTTSTLDHNPYNYSKVLAEKEAWKIHESQNQWDLVVINPSFVMGPSLTKNTNTGSIPFLLDFLNGKNKMGVPNLTFAYVDVRDVAKAHVLAAELDSANGRNIIANESLSMLEFSNLIQKNSSKKYPLPTKELPKFLLYLVGWTQGISWKFIRNNVGFPLKFDNSKGQKELGLKYRPISETIHDHVQQIEAFDLIK